MVGFLKAGWETVPWCLRGPPRDGEPPPCKSTQGRQCQNQNPKSTPSTLPSLRRHDGGSVWTSEALTNKKNPILGVSEKSRLLFLGWQPAFAEVGVQALHLKPLWQSVLCSFFAPPGQGKQSRLFVEISKKGRFSWREHG